MAEYIRQDHHLPHGSLEPTITNGDRIRQMSDEELANCFLEWVACTGCPVGQTKCKTEWANCTKAALDWLRKEADSAY